MPVGNLPSGTRPVERRDGRIVLAEGEATGHAHAIAERDAELRAAGWDEPRRFLVVRGGPATLEHEEHDALVVPPGVYQVRRQRELGVTPRPDREPRGDVRPATWTWVSD